MGRIGARWRSAGFNLSTTSADLRVGGGALCTQVPLHVRSEQRDPELQPAPRPEQAHRGRGVGKDRALVVLVARTRTIGDFRMGCSRRLQSGALKARRAGSRKVSGPSAVRR